ncbi:MAG: hypothetical protein K2M06_04965 [Muribaculaceae bacterium]|nr:hypothetical protein [Muribaculaceae bacterium]
MGILSNIEVSVPDTIALATTPKEVIFHSCPSSTTIEDICLAAIIGLIIIGGLLIIGYFGSKIVSSVQNAKERELRARQAHELAKLQHESGRKEEKDRYDSAWRVIEHLWKESKDNKANLQMDSTVDEALDYIISLWKAGRPSENSVNEKAGEPNS